MLNKDEILLKFSHVIACLGERGVRKRVIEKARVLTGPGLTEDFS